MGVVSGVECIGITIMAVEFLGGNDVVGGKKSVEDVVSLVDVPRVGCGLSEKSA